MTFLKISSDISFNYQGCWNLTDFIWEKILWNLYSLLRFFRGLPASDSEINRSMDRVVNFEVVELITGHVTVFEWDLSSNHA